LPAFKPLTGPHCHRPIHPQQLRDWECPWCHAAVGVARSCGRCAGLFAFASGIGIGVATDQSDSDGTWLLGVILSTIVCWFFFAGVIPPWQKPGRNRPRVNFLGLWLTYTIDFFVVEFLGLVSLQMLLIASEDAQRRHLEFLSTPLDLIGRNFLLTPANSFFDLCGILLRQQLLLRAPGFLLLSTGPVGFS
jgi:hypothetical protein